MTKPVTLTMTSSCWLTLEPSPQTGDYRMVARVSLRCSDPEHARDDDGLRFWQAVPLAVAERFASCLSVGLCTEDANEARAWTLLVEQTARTWIAAIGLIEGPHQCPRCVDRAASPSRSKLEGGAS